MPSTVPVVGNTELDKAHALNKFKETLSRIAIIQCDKSIIKYELSPTGSRGGGHLSLGHVPTEV